MFNNYIGKAGQLYVMSELLMLGWNVAIPEVDRGDDIFVVKDSDGDLRRVQVKTASARETKQGYIAQFLLPRLQLVSQPTPELYYTMLIRRHDRWSELIVLTRSDLADLLAEQLRQVGLSKAITLTLSLMNNSVFCLKTPLEIPHRLKDLFVRVHH
ncbi:hypothetical protein J2I47_18450 [Fibrella sp. HMF5335]|uniref:PD(D/E)XK endonuclease domain-containing protein n=1 Tax=Fibrella rubiginis TaxID=2817060 RepID=A0A939GGF4_9BACT|nr:hypothetical protein [Fibrella rubiginis]MBO0938539.1 hypothetical protein [Fibrella rubiginis]